jgi:hypothetical protein
MDMNDMVDRCTDMMGPIIGGSMIGNSIMLVVLMALLFIWLVGLGAVGALRFWGVRRLSRMRPDSVYRL